MRYLLFAALAPALWGQGATLGLSGASGTSGTSVSLNLSLTATNAAAPAAIQWTLAYPSTSLGPVTFAAGAALAAAGKSLICHAGSSSVTCVAYGVNTTTIANGVVAVATVPILPTAITSSVTLTPTNVAAAFPLANPDPIGATGGVVSIQGTPAIKVSSVSVSPTSIVGGNNLNVTVALSGPAPSGGVSVVLGSSNTAAVPASTVSIAAGKTTQTFSVATLAVTAAATVDITASYNSSSAKSAAFTVTPPPAVIITSISVSPVSIVGGNNLSATVTLSGPAPGGGVAVVLASSNPAIVPASTVSIGGGKSSQTFSVATLAVTASSTVELSASYNSSSATSGAFTVTPASIARTGTASYLKTDLITEGSWIGVYGADGYNVINNKTSYPAYVTVTPAGMASLTWSQSTTDPRALETANSSGRIAACWYNSGPFTIGMQFKDKSTHQVALYLVDFDSQGRSETITVQDSNSNVLDTRNVSSFSGGEYLVWNLTGNVVIRITNNESSSNVVVSGLFFGGAGATTTTNSTAKFLTTDTTTAGAWKDTYGKEGYNVISNAVSYPSYAAVTVSGEQNYTWGKSAADTSTLLTAASSSQRISSAWYTTGTMKVNFNFTDGLSHQVAIYLVDYDKQGRSETVEIVSQSGVVLDTRSVSSFSSGEYLVWDLSGPLSLQITNGANSVNAVLSGIFFGGPLEPVSSASFVKSDPTTSGNWPGVYGADGFNIIGNTASYPSYASVQPAGNYLYLWSNPTTDPRSLVTTSSPVKRIAACWFANSFTIRIGFSDGITHQVALYFLDFDGRGRSETVQITDTAGNVLDTRSVSHFSGGEYLVWNLSGQVVLKFADGSSSPNAVVSGIFFR